MGYDCTISFTLDTICPWTFLAKRRLSRALAQVRETNPAVTFTVKYLPYQLYPEASQDGEDKYEWYRRAKYDGSDDRMRKYMLLMSSYGAPEGIDYHFHGTVANTLPAHRLIWHVQETKGAEAADRCVEALYTRYFEREMHPSSPETLIGAATEAGMSEDKARAFVEGDEGVMDVKMLIREQAGNGVDAVPYVIMEGKRRDLTLEGAREVSEYVKAMEQIIKEAS